MEMTLLLWAAAILVGWGLSLMALASFFQRSHGRSPATTKVAGIGLGLVIAGVYVAAVDMDQRDFVGWLKSVG